MKNKSIKSSAIYNVINQGCVILFQLVTVPFVSRILHSTNYGRVNFSNSILSYFLLLAQLGTTSYVIREGAAIREDKEKVEKLTREIFTINFIATIVSILLYLASIFMFEKLHDNRQILYVLGIQLILNVFNVEWLNNIYEDFKYIAIRNSLIQVLSLVATLFFVRSEDDTVLYAFILAIAASLNYCVNFFHCRKIVKIRLTTHSNIKSHILPILILFFNALAVSIYVNSDITILGLLKSDDVVGVYSVAVKIYTVVKKIFQAVVIVSVPRLSNYFATGQIGNYKGLLRRMHDVVLTIVIPMLVGLILVSKNAVLIVSGEEYIEATGALQILCLALIFSSLANYYISCVLLPNKKEKMILVSTIISSIINVGLNFVLIPLLSLNGAAVTTVIAEATVMFLALYAADEYRQLKDSFSTYLKIAVGCVGIFVVCVGVDLVGFGLLANTVAKIVCSVLIYFIIEIIVKNQAIYAFVKKLFIKNT